MKSEVVSGILAQALVKLPRITMIDLHEKCKAEIGNVGLAQFRLEVAAWLKDGTIPGYESRKGKTGGIYKKGSPNELSEKQKDSSENEVDPSDTAEMLNGILNNQPRITAGELFQLVSSSYPTLTEAQFRPLLSKWLHDGTIPGYEIRKGITGGIYRVGSNVEKFVPTTFESDDVKKSEGSFTLEISPSIRVVRSDERNWSIQKKSGETWISMFYHSTLTSALNSVVRHILNGEFKLADSTMVNIKDTIKVLKEIEKRIFNQLTD